MRQVKNANIQAINDFTSRSAFGEAVQFASDKVTSLDVAQIQSMYAQAMLPAEDNYKRRMQETLAKSMEIQQKIMARSGINMDAQQYSLMSSEQQKTTKQVSELAEGLGVKVRFDATLPSTTNTNDFNKLYKQYKLTGDSSVLFAAGMYDNTTKEIVINPLDAISPIQTLAHELTHSVEDSSSYQTLKEVLFEGLSDEAMINKLEKQGTLQFLRDNGYANLSNENLLKEYVAIEMQPLLGNESFMKKLAKHNSSFLHRLYESVSDALNITTENDYTRDIEKAFEKAFRESDRITFETGELPQFSLSIKQQQILDKAIQEGKILSIEEAVKIADKGKDLGVNSILISKDVPQWIMDIGGGDKGLFMHPNHVKTQMGISTGKSQEHLHSLSKEVMYALPELIKKPIAVFDYKGNGTYLAFLHATDKNGNIIVASFKPEGKGLYNKIAFATPFMTSAYGKEEVFRFYANKLKDAQIVHPENINKKQVLTSIARLQLSGVANLPVDYILSRTSQNVNTQDNNIQQSHSLTPEELKKLNKNASYTNHFLKAMSGSDTSIYQGKNSYQEYFASVKKMNSVLDKILEAREKTAYQYQDTLEKMLVTANDEKVSFWATMEQNLDSMTNHKELREELRHVFELPKQEAQTRHAILLKEAQDTLDSMIELGVRAGTKEAQAAQYFREGHTPEGRKYTQADLMRDFPNTYENIEKAANIYGEFMDKWYHVTNDVLSKIYGDTKTKNELVLAKLAGKLSVAEKAYNELLKQSEDGMTTEIQAGLNKLELEKKRLTTQYNTLSHQIQTGDAERRQKLQYRKNYVHHIFAKPSFISSLFESVRSRIPTALSGISNYSKPRSAYASFFSKQTGSTSYKADLVESLSEYAKDASKVIAYDPLIDYYRSVANDLRASAKDSEMSKFVNWLDSYTNALAGKTTTIDRTVKEIFGEKGLGMVKKLAGIAKSNAIVGNLRTSVVQFANIPNGIAVLQANGGKGTALDLVKGTSEYMRNIFNGHTDMELSPFLSVRFNGDLEVGKKGFMAGVDKTTAFLLSKGDEIATRMIWNSAYQQALRLNKADPITYADDIARRSVAGRSIGEIPLALQSSTANLIIPFQIEVNNLLRTNIGMWRDKKLNAFLVGTIAAWLFNEFMEKSPLKDRPLPDLIDAAIEIMNGEANNSFGRILGEALKFIPGSQWVGSFSGMSDFERQKFFGDADPSRFGTGNIGLQPIIDSVYNLATMKDKKKAALDSASDLFFNYITPFGGKQMQRTIEGAQSMAMLPQYNDGEFKTTSAVYNKSGQINFMNNPDNLYDKLVALAFGKWNTENAQAYFKGDIKVSKSQSDHIKNLGENYEAFDIANELKPFRKKTDFITYLSEMGLTPERKEKVLDEYYSNNPLNQRINEVAEQKNFDANTEFELEKLITQAEADKDENGATVKNSKALKVRKGMEQLGIYDEIVDYIEKQQMEAKHFGLNKTVMEKESLDNKEKKKKKTSKASAVSQKRKTVRSSKEFSKQLEEAIAKVGGAGARQAYARINSILKKKANGGYSSITNIKKAYFRAGVQKFVTAYLKDHPYDRDLFY